MSDLVIDLAADDPVLVNGPPATPATNLPMRGKGHHLAADLVNAGYVLGSPPWLSAAALVIDEDTAAGEPCEKCGGPCLLVACYRVTPRSYKALACCQSCGDACEF